MARVVLAGPRRWLGYGALVLAFAAGLFVIGLSIGHNFWLAFLALPLVPVAVVGWVYEYYRGHFAR